MGWTAAGGGIVLFVGTAFEPGRLEAYSWVENPLAVQVIPVALSDIGFALAVAPTLQPAHVSLWLRRIDAASDGTRFLDIADPASPRQVAYWRPDDGVVWASYFHRGYVNTADRTRGVDGLRLTRGSRRASRARREVFAPSPSARQRRFLTRIAWRLRADPGTAGLCFLESQ